MKKIFVLTLLICFVLSVAFAQQKNIKVYVTEKGKKYHVRTCRTIKDSEVSSISKEEAEKLGLTACKICKP